MRLNLLGHSRAIGRTIGAALLGAALNSGASAQINNPYAYHPALQFYEAGYPPGGFRRSDGTVVYNIGSGPLTVGFRPKKFLQIELPPGETIISKALEDTVRFEDPDTGFGPDLTRRMVVVKLKASPRNQRDADSMTTQLLIYTNGPSGKYTLTVHPMLNGPANGTQIAFASMGRVLRQATGPTGPTNSAQVATMVAQAGGGISSDAALLPETTPQPCFRRDSEVHYGGWEKATAEFKPVEVFEDGIHTCVVMPTNLRSLPIVLEDGPEGTEVANYRYLNSTFIVDGVRDRVYLQLGTTNKADRVTIDRQPGPKTLRQGRK